MIKFDIVALALQRYIVRVVPVVEDCCCSVLHLYKCHFYAFISLHTVYQIYLYERNVLLVVFYSNFAKSNYMYKELDTLIRLTFECG